MRPRTGLAGALLLVAMLLPHAAVAAQEGQGSGEEEEADSGVVVDEDGFGAWTGAIGEDAEQGASGGSEQGGEDAPGSDRGAPPAPYEIYGQVVPGPGCDWDTEVLVQVLLVEHDEDWVRSETVVGYECYELTEWEAERTPEPPTVSPGYAAQLAKVRWPTPTFQMNPDDFAVTGIETRVWYGDDGGLALTRIDHDGDPATPGLWGATVTVSDPAGINTITVSAWISQYVWEMGDGTRLTSDRPGSAEDWAEEHIYTRTSEENHVQALTVWNGSFTATGPGGTVSGPIPTTTVSGERVSYPVYQVRSAPAARSGG